MVSRNLNLRDFELAEASCLARAAQLKELRDAFAAEEPTSVEQLLQTLRCLERQAQTHAAKVHELVMSVGR